METIDKATIKQNKYHELVEKIKKKGLPSKEANKLAFLILVEEGSKLSKTEKKEKEMLKNKMTEIEKAEKEFTTSAIQ